MQQVLIGADPELFLQAPDGKFVSSVGLIGGSKAHPMPIDEEGCAIQEDNVAVEYNIPACKSADEFLHYNKKVLANITERAQQMGLSLKIIPSAVFDEDQLQTPEACEFGCEPDFNAWKNGTANPRPHADDQNLRSAGGHIHIGGVKDLNPLHLVQAMDLFVGCQMVTFDNDTRRRLLYGGPGAFRPKKYGVEYRTASNAWIATDERIKWAYDQTQKAVDWVRAGNVIDEEWGLKIQECIMNSDMQLLQEINQHFDIN